MDGLDEARACSNVSHSNLRIEGKNQQNPIPSKNPPQLKHMKTKNTPNCASAPAASGNPPTMIDQEVLDEGEEFLRMAETFVRQIRAGDAQRALERGVILEGRLAPLNRMLYHAANTHS